MFDPTSRYYTIETAKLDVTDSDGLPRVIAYKRRRFIPASNGLVTIVEHTVVQGDRLDNLTARYLGDPLQFWRICDANNVLRPDDLIDEAGTIIQITLPKIG
jgi:nucleoid-associated protein YgaU